MVSNLFHFLDRWLLRVLKAMCTLTLAAVVFSVTLGIVFRYVFKSPLPWVEEFSRLNFIWTTFMGACVATREGRHLKIQIFSHRLTPRGLAIHDVVVSCFALFFLIAVLMEGRLVYEAMGMQNYAGMPLSQKWQALPMILGSFVMAVYFIGILISGVLRMAKVRNVA